MSKNKPRYIICGDNGPMSWQDEQLVYEWPSPQGLVQVFDSRQQAQGLIVRSKNWRKKMGFDAGGYWIYRLAE